MRLPLPSLAALALASAVLAACGGPDRPPDLLLVSIDTLRADAVGAYGQPLPTTPALDAFAADAALFESAWSHSPKTAPAHMSMLTGLPPRVHGVGNLDTAGATALPPDAVPLAEVLRARGFAAAGFTGGGNVKATLGFARGFEVYDDESASFAVKLARTRSWIEDRPDGEPWFVFLHTYAVHDPYLPPREFAERFLTPGYEGGVVGDREALRAAIAAGEDYAPQRRGHAKLTGNYGRRVAEDDPRDAERLRELYLAGVAAMDATLAELFAWLEDSGRLDTTLVVVTSDHGEEFGEHGRLRHDQLRREVTQVPLVVRDPRGRGRGARLAAPVRHVDLLPSVLDLLGVEDAGVPRLGRSWAPWLEGEVEAAPRPVLSEHRSLRERELDLWALRADGHLLHADRESTTLHDLAVDPEELSPLEDPALRERLEADALAERALLDRLAADYAAGERVVLDAALEAELRALGYLEGEPP